MEGQYSLALLLVYILTFLASEKRPVTACMEKQYTLRAHTLTHMCTHTHIRLTMPTWRSTVQMRRFTVRSCSLEVMSFSTANTTPSLPRIAMAVLREDELAYPPHTLAGTAHSPAVLYRLAGVLDLEDASIRRELGSRQVVLCGSRRVCVTSLWQCVICYLQLTPVPMELMVCSSAQRAQLAEKISRGTRERVRLLE